MIEEVLRYFPKNHKKSIEVLCEELFSEGFEIVSISKTDGESHNFDGIFGYLVLPRVFLQARDKKTGKTYKLVFEEDSYGSIGTIQYLWLDFEGKSKTNILGNWDKNKLRARIREYLADEMFDLIVIQ